MNLPQNINISGELLMGNIISQEARKRQAIVKYALKKGKSKAAAMYGVSLSSIKRWCKRYDGTWQSLKEKSHRPHHHPSQHTQAEEKMIYHSFQSKFLRWGWDGVYEDLLKQGYTRSLSGMVYAAKRMGLGSKIKRKAPRKNDRRFPECLLPGEKVQIDVKEVPFNCLKNSAKINEKRFYQYTAIDECTRVRFIYGFEEHTPENSVRFLKMVQQVFPFKIKVIQTDNGTEFTYKYISDDVSCPFDLALTESGIEHKLIPPRTPWHNGKVERSHRNDQRYFYDWEKFGNIDELNRKLREHLHWSNNKPMRIFAGKSPLAILRNKLNQG